MTEQNKIFLTTTDYVFIEKAKKYIKCLNSKKGIIKQVPSFDYINNIFDRCVKNSLYEYYLYNLSNKNIGNILDLEKLNIELVTYELSIPNTGVYLRDYPNYQLILNMIICENRKSPINIMDIIIGNKRSITLRELREICEVCLDIQYLFNGLVHKVINMDRVGKFLEIINKTLNYEKSKDYGKFIVFEGCDTVGKDYILNNIKFNKDKVYITREPGGPVISEKIRSILLDNNHSNSMSYKTEALLYAASRSQHVEETIIPMLQCGLHVISNRYYHSSVLYQTKRRGVANKDIQDITLFAIDKYFPRVPNLTFSFFTDEKTILNRLENKVAKDRLEQESSDFYIKINDEYSYLDTNKVIRNIDYDRVEKIIPIYVDSENETTTKRIYENVEKELILLCGNDVIVK